MPPAHDILRRNVPVQNGHHTRLTGRVKAFLAPSCQRTSASTTSHERNQFPPTTLRQAADPGWGSNDYPLAFGIHHDGGLRRFRRLYRLV